MKKFKEIAEIVSSLFIAIIPIVLLVLWIFNSDLTMMQMAFKFWYLLVAFCISFFTAFWSEDIHI